jgi:hypothetical protein
MLLYHAAGFLGLAQGGGDEVAAFLLDFLKRYPQFYGPILGLVLLWGVLKIVAAIKKTWDEGAGVLFGLVYRYFYRPEDRERVGRRHAFADHLRTELKSADDRAQWHDEQFAELEAEVEIHDSRTSLSFLPFISVASTLRRERSLTRALAASQERIILLEGDPGAGKSVALRHLAQVLLAHAFRSKNPRTRIPIYVNLKELKRSADQPIDSTLILAFVLEAVNRVKQRQVATFLESEFDPGLAAGTWLFLFDSFDEIPEILSSTEPDQAIMGYTQALWDFLHGMNRCRGIVASRQFRGPRQSNWPRFRIVPLSVDRQLELVDRSPLTPARKPLLKGALAKSDSQLYLLAGNPLFLRLLCDYVQQNGAVPHTAHVVIEAYVERRLTVDEVKFPGVTKAALRTAAERIAFCISADSSLGLSPPVVELRHALHRAGFSQNAVPAVSEALDAIRLVRLTGDELDGSRELTFAHRRFQEYFATCLVIREPKRVSPRELLTNGRWRETAVTLCQTQPVESLQALMGAAGVLLAEMAGEARSSLAEDGKLEGELPRAEGSAVEIGKIQPFPWPTGLLHLLTLLQDGFVGRVHELAPGLRSQVDELVRIANRGTLLDRKWILECAGVATSEVFTDLLREGFGSKSQWLQDVAYQQTARLGRLPSKIRTSICVALVHMALSGQLGRERHASYAHLARLDEPTVFLRIRQVLLAAPWIDWLLRFLLAVYLQVLISRGLDLGQQLQGMLQALIIGSPLLLWHAPRLGTTRRTIGTGAAFMLVAISFGVENRPLQSEGIPEQHWFGVAALYVSSWAPAALFLSESAVARPTRWWPFFPLLFLVTLLRDIRFPKLSTGFVRRHWKQILLLGLCAGFVQKAMDAFGDAPIYLLIVLVTLGLPLLLLLGMVVFTVTWISDLIILAGWARGPFRPVPALQLLDTWSRLYHVAAAVRVIRTAYADKVMIPGADSVKLVQTLLTAAEAKSRSDQTAPNYLELGGQRYKIRAVNHLVVDELARLLEHLLQCESPGAGKVQESSAKPGRQSVSRASEVETVQIESIATGSPQTGSTETEPMKPAKSEEPVEVFFSYSHADETLRDELAKHLKLLQRQGVIQAWHDRQITPGGEWKGEIDAHLESARIILLLVSPDYMASDYCWDVETKRAMERHEAGEAMVIPIALRPVDWHGAPFGKLQGLPKDIKPVTSWPNQDEAFLNIAQGIRAVAQRLAT